MYAALKFILDQLILNAAITVKIAANNIYPVIASAKVDPIEFIVFNVFRNSTYTKDGKQDYTAEVSVFRTDIMEAAKTADIVEEELTNHNTIYGTSASVEYSDDLQRAFVKLIFTFKI